MLRLTELVITTTESKDTLPSSSKYEGFPSFWDNHDSKELRIKVAAYLENELVKSGVKTLPADEKEISDFHSVSIPIISITDYFNRLIECLHLPAVVYIAGLYLLNLIRKDIPLDYLTIHRLLLTTLYVANQQITMCVDNSEQFANVGGVSKAEFIHLVNEFNENKCINYHVVNFKEHHALLYFLLNAEINHDAAESTKTVLNEHLIKAICSYVVSPYITTDKTQAPSAELADYVSYCRLFTPKIQGSEFTSSISKVYGKRKIKN